MKKEEIERQTLNYIVGGSIPMLVLMPFLIECINIAYQNITLHNLNRFDGVIICSFAYFILFTIIFTNGIYKLNKYQIKDVHIAYLYYYLYSTFYLLIGGYYLLKVFYIPSLISLILSLTLSLISLYTYYRFKKKLLK